LPQADKDIRSYQKTGNKKAIRKIQTILKELQLHPTKGICHPEKLKYELSGYWSRRNTKKEIMEAYEKLLMNNNIHFIIPFSTQGSIANAILIRLQISLLLSCLLFIFHLIIEETIESMNIELDEGIARLYKWYLAQ
jgi:Txe/YoeB family toxin of toxin-antitoxin system